MPIFFPLLAFAGCAPAIEGVWQFSVDTLSGQLITLRGTAHAAALHAALHDAYEGRELFTTRRTNPFYELRRR